MKKIIFIALYLLSPFLLMGVLYTSIPTRYADTQLLLTLVFGSFAYTWLTFQLILSARPKFVERVFGMDKLYRFHGLIAIAAVVTAFLHRQLIEEIFPETVMTTIGTIAMLTFIVITISSLIFLTTSKLHKIKAVKWVKKTTEKILKLKYEHVRLVHNLTVIAFILMNIHVLMTTNAKFFPAVRTLYWVYGVTAMVFYLYHKFLKPYLLKQNPYAITQIVKESPNMWTLTLTPKKKGMKSFRPGQFAFFTFLTQHPEEHPFSISSSPDTLPNLTVTIKELGDFTKTIGQLVVGTEVLVEGPFGRFTHTHHPKEDASVFVAGGVGITPILSMVRHLAVHESDREVVLIWGMNTLQDHIVKEELEAATKSMKRFQLIPVVAFDPTHPGEKGFIDKEKIDRLLSKDQLLREGVGYYVCGPAILMDNTIKHLSSLGIKRNQIHFEKFSL